jgi:hypothetical protein
MQILELPKSKLRLDSEELVKSGPGDAVVARYPTDHIERIALEKTHEYGTAFLLVAVFASLAFVSNQYVESAAWSWTGVIVCLGICGLVVSGIEGRNVVIETTGGTTQYPVADLFEEAEGFVLSANTLLGLDGFESKAQAREDKPLPPTSGD